MLKIHINVMRENRILAHGSFEFDAWDDIPLERFYALEGVTSTDEEDGALLGAILDYFVMMLVRGEATRAKEGMERGNDGAVGFEAGREGV